MAWPYGQADGQWKTGFLNDSYMCHSPMEIIIGI